MAFGLPCSEVTAACSASTLSSDSDAHTAARPDAFSGGTSICSNELGAAERSRWRAAAAARSGRSHWTRRGCGVPPALTGSGDERTEKCEMPGWRSPRSAPRRCSSALSLAGSSHPTSRREIGRGANARKRRAASVGAIGARGSCPCATPGSVSGTVHVRSSLSSGALFNRDSSSACAPPPSREPPPPPSAFAPCISSQLSTRSKHGPSFRSNVGSAAASSAAAHSSPLVSTPAS